MLTAHKLRSIKHCGSSAITPRTSSTSSLRTSRDAIVAHRRGTSRFMTTPPTRALQALRATGSTEDAEHHPVRCAAPRQKRQRRSQARAALAIRRVGSALSARSGPCPAQGRGGGAVDPAARARPVRVGSVAAGRGPRDGSRADRSRSGARHTAAWASAAATASPPRIGGGARDIGVQSRGLHDVRWCRAADALARERPARQIDDRCPFDEDGDRRRAGATTDQPEPLRG